MRSFPWVFQNNVNLQCPQFFWFLPRLTCVFIGLLGNTNAGGHLTSQESAVLLVGCRFLGGQPTSQDDANLHMKISKNSTSRCWCGGRQVCPCAQGFPKNGWRSYDRPPGNTVITKHDTCRNSKGGKRHPRRDVRAYTHKRNVSIHIFYVTATLRII